MKKFLAATLVVGCLAAPLAVGAGETREEMVRGDKKKRGEDEHWIYNDLTKAFEAAKTSGKPLMVVFRCIPCEACKVVDEDVAQRDILLKELLDRFVCVRVVQANRMDLKLFQFDYDMSWAVIFMNSDQTVYARFGTRFEQKNGNAQASLQGLRQTLEAVLAVHQAYPGNKASLAGKQPKPTAVATPEGYPKLKDYGPSIDYQGNAVKSCMHCHMIRDAEREANRAALSEQMIYPYPMPETIGLALDPASRAKIAGVTAGSVAEKAGVQTGDELVSLDAQPIYSIADAAWVLHHFAGGALAGEVRRGAQTLPVSFALDAGWRKNTDISWRTTTWAFRAKALGGLKLDEVPADEMQKLGLAPGALALKAAHVGQYGIHAVAKNAGFLQNDVIVEFDGQSNRLSESQLIGYLLQKHQPGESVEATILRGGTRLKFTFKIQ